MSYETDYGYGYEPVNQPLNPNTNIYDKEMSNAIIELYGYDAWAELVELAETGVVVTNNEEVIGKLRNMLTRFKIGYHIEPGSFFAFKLTMADPKQPIIAQ